MTRCGTAPRSYVIAALKVATGEVIYRDQATAQRQSRSSGIFKLINLHVPRHLNVHVDLENLSAHKAPAVAKWLDSSLNEAVASPLGPHLFLLAQPGRRVVQTACRPAAPPRNFEAVSMLSSRPLKCGPSAGTTTPNPSYGP